MPRPFTEAVTSSRLVTEIASSTDAKIVRVSRPKLEITSSKLVEINEDSNIVNNEEANDENNSEDPELSSLNDSKDKRRHYLIKSKQFLQLGTLHLKTK